MWGVYVWRSFVTWHLNVCMASWMSQEEELQATRKAAEEEAAAAAERQRQEQVVNCSSAWGEFVAFFPRSAFGLHCWGVTTIV